MHIDVFDLPSLTFEWTPDSRHRRTGRCCRPSLSTIRTVRRPDSAFPVYRRFLRASGGGRACTHFAPFATQEGRAPSVGHVETGYTVLAPDRPCRQRRWGTCNLAGHATHHTICTGYRQSKIDPALRHGLSSSSGMRPPLPKLGESGLL